MKKMKLFPKTFLYVFSLMAFITLISHGLFFFFMPIVYTGRKEAAFREAKTRLTEELREVSWDSPDNMKEIVRKYALQNQISIFVSSSGQSYHYVVSSFPFDGSFPDSATAAQGEFSSDWRVQIDDEIDWKEEQQDFYRKTDSKLISGAGFQTGEGRPCYLVMSSTLQPVYEAKSAVVILLPFTLLLSLVLSVLFALLYSKKITRPLTEISKTTERMKSLDKSALCRVGTGDEIGVLSHNINELYESLLASMENIRKESMRVSEAEAAKIDFLRAASHELKTPVTALCGMLDNMIMGIGRYKDWETYLPVCRDMALRFGVMIQEILDASKMDLTFAGEPMEETALHCFVEKLLVPHLLIAKSKGVFVDTDFSAKFPGDAMEKVLNNLLSNAVKYTAPQGTVRIYFARKSIVVENECSPIPPESLSRIFEPFYRPDFSRSRGDTGENPGGGNGLGLYIAAKILNALEYKFSFEPFFPLDGEKKGGMRFTIFFCG